MFRKYKQSSKSQKKSPDLVRDQAVSFPSIKLLHHQKSQRLHERIEKTTLRYNSERRISFRNIENDNIRPILKVSKQLPQRQTYEFSPLPKSYPSTQNLRAVAEREMKSLSSKQINISPQKKARLQNLPAILVDMQFVKKIEDSLNSSRQQEQIQKSIYAPEKNTLNLQFKLTCKSKKFFKTRKSVDEIIGKKLQFQQKKQLITSGRGKQREKIVEGPNLSVSQKGLLANSSRQIQVKKVNNNPVKGKQKLVGPEAVQKFYSHYKRIDRIRQLQEIRKQVNPLTIVLTILQSYNIPPKKMDIIKVKGTESILDLNQIGLGQSVSIKAISDILQKLRYFESINLSYNSISSDRVDIIIPKLRGLTKIDLSHNRIGKQGVDLLANEVCVLHHEDSEDEKHFLEELNLQENGLSDVSLNLFLIKAKPFSNLRILNLSRNFLGNNFAARLKDFLINQDNLDELYLHWNDITSKGMKYIFEGLAMNRNLKVLDLSWNEIGYEAIPAINNFFRKNTELLHLDISNCNINLNDTNQLAEAIKQNNTIIGLHFQGNKGAIDSQGFIQPLVDENDSLQGSLRSQILSRIKGVDRNQIHNQTFNFKQDSHLRTCWICDGWQQKTINVIKIKESDLACFIHFDFNDYKGIAMGLSEGNYQIKKMVPHRKITFFVTKINKKKEFIHQASTHFKGANAFQIKKLQTPLYLNQFWIEKKEFTNIYLNQINVMSNFQEHPPHIFDYYYEYQASCKPRENSVFFDYRLLSQTKGSGQSDKKKVKVKKERSRKNDKKVRELPTVQIYFDESLINSQRSKEFTGKCVSFDIENTKIKKLVSSPEEIQNITQILQQHYQTFVNVYSYLSSNSVNGVTSIYFISQNRLEHFLDFMQFQTRSLTRVKIRLKMIAALSLNDDSYKNQHKNHESEQKLLNRPLFFQFLLRLSIQKYSKKSKIEDENQGVMSVSEGFSELLKSLARFQRTLKLPSQWRSEHLITYDISLAIKSYENFIESIYNFYTGIFQKNISVRNEKKMLLNEFKQIFLDAQMKKSRQSLKDAELAFIQSKVMQVQDGSKEYGLTFNQFLQALIRISHKNNLKPIGTEEYKIWQRIEEMISHHQIKNSQSVEFQIPLFLKFQAILKKIYLGNSKLYHSRRMNLVFEKGLFHDEAEMMVELFKERMEQYHKKNKLNALQSMKKLKINSVEFQQQKLIETPQNQRLHAKITLPFLVQQLKQKYRKLAQELDRNFNEYQQVSQTEANKEKEEIP